MVKVALCAGCFVAHLALTLMSVAHLIGCGTGGGCVTTLDRVWNQVLAFPIFSLMELLDGLSPGIHASGNTLTVLIPLNSLVFTAIAYALLTKLSGAAK